MPSSADLDRIRWDWSKEAIGRMRAELRGIQDEVTEHTDLAHVMVLGDTQVGKTSLLLRLLGVTDPVLAQEAGEPLRGGRDRGRSATAVPIRYQWSGDADRWSLVYDADRRMEWLTSAELAARLTEYRAGNRLRWNVADRPLEIGLPERLAGPDPRHDLRVFDLPGLYAAEPQEQDVARRLIADYVPVMNFVVLVLSGDQFAEQLLSPTIAENPFLSQWGEQPDRFHLVLTRAFSNARVREVLGSRLGPITDPVGWDPVQVRELTRAHFDDQLTRSGLPSGHPETLFPVEIADSWRELLTSPAADDRCYAGAVAAANDLLLDALGRTLVGFSDEVSAHLAAPEIARRIQTLVQGNRRRRQQEIDQVDDRVLAAEQATGEASDLVKAADDKLTLATERLALVRAGLAELSVLSINYQRPRPPEMIGNAVRAKQEQERASWVEAARSAWAQWRGRQRSDLKFAAQPPNQLDVRIRTEYDRRCACCQGCERGFFKRLVRDTGLPETCYLKMGSVDLRPWIRTELSGHAAPALWSAEQRTTEATRRSALAAENLSQRQFDEKAVRAELAALRKLEAKAEKEDADNLEVANTVQTRLEQANARFVRSLLARSGDARDGDRGLLFLAALRGAHDLERMFRR